MARIAALLDPEPSVRIPVAVALDLLLVFAVLVACLLGLPLARIVSLAGLADLRGALGDRLVDDLG